MFMGVPPPSAYDTAPSIVDRSYLLVVAHARDGGLAEPGWENPLLPDARRQDGGRGSSWVGLGRRRAVQPGSAAGASAAGVSPAQAEATWGRGWGPRRSRSCGRESGLPSREAGTTTPIRAPW
ncbi:hypothetical protein NDU88_000941 [Pleurodeles waltl]|uniref:Uncharacterized protein n=1 Tax=Pleurodeles waltl TaxID=8319 RepID=A0AAV7MNG8_PLEWA|nr:hypothetical protein NDU88_000941 [Pleurodeles waltl]